LIKPNPNSVVYVVDDDSDVRDGMKQLMESVGLRCLTFGSAAKFLEEKRTGEASCLILDIRLPGMGGLDFQRKLVEAGIFIPVIFITGYGDIPMTVKERARVMRVQIKEMRNLTSLLKTLTDREREVMTFVVTGLLNKQIASETGLAEGTVKVHRRNLMKKLGVKSVPELVRMSDLTNKIAC
jgi:FixJ family two-component response regulator